MSQEPLGNLNGSGIVTGGASGFGRACVERPRAEGMPVLVADVNVVQVNFVGTFLLGVRDLMVAIAPQWHAERRDRAPRRCHQIGAALMNTRARGDEGRWKRRGWGSLIWPGRRVCLGPG